MKIVLLVLIAFSALTSYAEDPFTCTGQTRDSKGLMQKVSVSADSSSIQLTIADGDPVAFPVVARQVASDGKMITAQRDDRALFGQLNKFVLVLKPDDAKLLTAQVGFNFNTTRDQATAYQYDLDCSI